MPVPGYETEADCKWQPLDSWLDLNIDETETWQKGLCSTFRLSSHCTDPLYCQIKSLSGLQYIHAPMPLSIRPHLGSLPMQIDGHSKAKRHRADRHGQRSATSPANLHPSRQKNKYSWGFEHLFFFFFPLSLHDWLNQVRCLLSYSHGSDSLVTDSIYLSKILSTTKMDDLSRRDAHVLKKVWVWEKSRGIRHTWLIHKMGIE